MSTKTKLKLIPLPAGLAPLPKGTTTKMPELENKLAAPEGLRTTDLFVGMRVRYENMEGEVEANPDYNAYANMEDYASGRLPAKRIYKWVVRCGTDGFYPESVLAHGGKLSPTNANILPP